MQTLTRIKELLAARGLAPRHALGQNFLIDQNLVRKLVDAGLAPVRSGGLDAHGPGPSRAPRVVLEVGPGTGTLTEELLARGCEVVACELDPGLASLLREALEAEHGRRLHLIEGDCLDSKREVSSTVLAALGGRPFTLIANLPYAAATPLMLALLTGHPECHGLYVTVQREVADRMLARPGTKDFGTLGIVAQAVAEPVLLASLPPECFWPRPEVTSAMVAVPRRAEPLTDDPARLADFCQAVFSRRRKQLGSVLGRQGPWPPGVSPTDRAESLSIPALIALSRTRAPV
ncbi:MAG: ribosomal RNA small subunit methyltransferase A [Phycisphaerales bacterium]|nr:ribosomal RNA small subunit methyltransferase A [Phycisphaerales bacterium]